MISYKDEIEFKCPSCDAPLLSAKKCSNCNQEFICLREGYSNGFRIIPKDINEEYLGRRNLYNSSGVFNGFTTC